mmetsp:Transcript_35915/g.77669  ORF Transcript_35915/g.77669 Transcript_35915/m.77669 type:complete len:276 (+) Transcript_35915:750-1577(+)
MFMAAMSCPSAFNWLIWFSIVFVFSCSCCKACFASSNPWKVSSDASSSFSFRILSCSSKLFTVSSCSCLKVSLNPSSWPPRRFSRVACSVFKAWPSSFSSSFKALVSPFALSASVFAVSMPSSRSFLTCSKLVSKAFLKASRSASSLSCTAFSQWAFKSCSSWSSFSWSLAGESFCSLSREACSSCRDSSRADNFDASAKLGSSSSFPLWVSMVRSSSSHLLSRVHKRGMTSCPSPLMRSSSALLEDSICFSKPFTVLSTTPKSLSRSDISFRLT